MKYFHIATMVVLITAAVSCKKEKTLPPEIVAQDSVIIPTPQPDSTASYTLIITGTWKMPELTVPAGNHFTRFEGMVHNGNTFIFHNAGLASLGVENVAEDGSNTALLAEMATAIQSGKALSTFSMSLSSITASDSVAITLKPTHSFISFESMIAPSPDWFAGLDSYNLIQNGQWVKEITIDIYGYDAGTEDGDIFGYSNPATDPQQKIAPLTSSTASVLANGNASVARFATLHIIRQ